MLSELDKKRFDYLYKLLEEAKKNDPDTASALRWAIFTLEQDAQPQATLCGLTKKDYLELWGYLQVLKSDFENKAKSVAQRGDATGDKFAGDYLRQVAAIQTMQERIDTCVANMED